MRLVHFSVAALLTDMSSGARTTTRHVTLDQLLLVDLSKRRAIGWMGGASPWTGSRTELSGRLLDPFSCSGSADARHVGGWRLPSGRLLSTARDLGRSRRANAIFAGFDIAAWLLWL